MNKEAKIESTVEAWESGSLGRDEAHVKAAKGIDPKALDESLELQMISIRLQKSLIKDLKTIAKLHGLSYQPLIRQTLTRFADCEMKSLFNEYVEETEKQKLQEKKEKEEENLRDCG